MTNGDSFKEEDLWEPIRRALVQRYREIRDCELVVTATGIPETVRRHLSKQSWENLLVEPRRPDIMGYTIDKHNNKEKRLVIAEVKKGSLTLEHIYQAKMYADMFRSNYPQAVVFLISPVGLDDNRRRIIKQDSPFLHSVDNVVYVMQYNPDDRTLKLYREFYRQDPFTLEYFHS